MPTTPPPAPTAHHNPNSGTGYRVVPQLQASGRENKKMKGKGHRWYLGGCASAGATVFTHPLDLLKVMMTSLAVIFLNTVLSWNHLCCLLSPAVLSPPGASIQKCSRVDGPSCSWGVVNYSNFNLVHVRSLI